MNEYATYIIHNYPSVLNEAESKAVRTLQLRMKAALTDDPRRSLARYRKMGRLYDNEPPVAALLSEGEATFYDRLVKRVQTECADKVFFNCCEACGGLTATPRAQQCFHCGHDWH